MTLYPALDIRGADPDLALAASDDYAPVAAESTAFGIRIFFSTARLRDAASIAMARTLAFAAITSLDVDDEDWARRSQESLGPIVVGRLTVRPAALAPAAAGLLPPRTRGDVTDSGLEPLEIVIEPSMGFGTGHHATTRLCLAALQRLDLRGRFVLDVGTGSGVLAIAARALGAAHALGVDCDPDAIRSADNNLPLNAGLDAVSFERRDLAVDPLPVADVVTANLTGALLCRTAGRLVDAVRPGGHVIVSGILSDERDAVLAACAALDLVWERREDEWVGMCFDRPNQDRV